MRLKYFLIAFLAFIHTSVKSQCVIDTVKIDYYTIVSNHAEINYISIDSTILYDKPHLSWIDVYLEGRIKNRYQNVSGKMKKNFSIEYNQENQIESITKYMRGIDNEIRFEYRDTSLIKILNTSRFFGKTEYDVESIKGGYKLNYFDNELKKKTWIEIDTTIISESECFNYGVNRLLDIKFNLKKKQVQRKIQLEIWTTGRAIMITQLNVKLTIVGIQLCTQLPYQKPNK